MNLSTILPLILFSVWCLLWFFVFISSITKIFDIILLCNPLPIWFQLNLSISLQFYCQDEPILHSSQYLLAPFPRTWGNQSPSFAYWRPYYSSTCLARQPRAQESPPLHSSPWVRSTQNPLNPHSLSVPPPLFAPNVTAQNVHSNGGILENLDYLFLFLPTQILNLLPPVK